MLEVVSVIDFVAVCTDILNYFLCTYIFLVNNGDRFSPVLFFSFYPFLYSSLYGVVLHQRDTLSHSLTFLIW